MFAHVQTRASDSWQTHKLESDTFDDGESGWGGVSFDDSGDTLVAARAYQRTIATYDVKVCFAKVAITWQKAGRPSHTCTHTHTHTHAHRHISS